MLNMGYLFPPTYKQELVKQIKQSSNQLLNIFVVSILRQINNIYGKNTQTDVYLIMADVMLDIIFIDEWFVREEKKFSLYLPKVLHLG